jgi:YegS/Rv2252/BmrU family lipid kinase
MAKEQIAFIINPHAGRKKRRISAETILKHLDQSRFSPQFYFTEYRGHAKVLAQQAVNEKCHFVVAAGGDGTVNEIASALASSDIPLGIIPSGSGNGLARHMGIPLTPAKAIHALNEARIERIDAGRINDTWFFCTCGVGFDAKIGFKFSKINKRGFLGYLKIIIREYHKYNIKKYRFSVDGEKFRRKAFLITIANASQYGNNAFIAPRAQINDGLFDICIVKPFPRWKVFFIAFHLMKGSIDHSEYYEYLRGRSVRFKKPRKKYIIHYDGEPIKIKKEKIKIELAPLSLQVLVPVR